MSRIRLGIIGAGQRGINCLGKELVVRHADKVDLVAMADPNRERAEGGLRALDLTADIHATPEELLARKDIDAVVITSPDYLHGEQCVMAFDHGKHVLVDKPLAITGTACLSVIEASRKADKLLYMGFNLRHDPVLVALKKKIMANALGRVFSVHAIEHYNGGRTYMSRWNRLKEYSGGLWIHKGSHDFDVINWLLEGARPVSVSCIGDVTVLNEDNLPFELRPGVKPGPTCTACPYAAECPDVIGRELDVTDAKIQKHIQDRDAMFGAKAAEVDNYHKDLCMYLSDKDTHDHGFALVDYDTGAMAMHSECFVTPISDRKYVLDGTRGNVMASLHDCQIDMTPRWSQDRITHQLARGEGGHGGADPMMCQEFVACILNDRHPRASGVDGAWSVAIGQACEIARAEKRVVRIEEVLDVDSDLLPS